MTEKEKSTLRACWIIILVLVIITIGFRLATYLLRLEKSVTPF